MEMGLLLSKWVKSHLVKLCYKHTKDVFYPLHYMKRKEYTPKTDFF